MRSSVDDLWPRTDLAGIHATPSHLEVEDPLRGLTVAVPNTVEHQIEGPGPARIEWLMRDTGGTVLPLDRSCLRQFIRLAAAADTDIAKFARRWGPLGIARDGRAGFA